MSPLVSATDDRRKRWDARLLRVKELAELHKPIASALHFYHLVLEFQAEISSQSRLVFDPDVPLRAQIDVKELQGCCRRRLRGYDLTNGLC